jgi:hypothetical protein
MKKVNFKLLAMFFAAFAMGLSFTACEDDNSDDVDPTDTTIVQGDVYTYTIGSTQFEVDKVEKTVTIKDNGDGVSTMTWTADTTYILDGFVFVNEGQELTIEAGTMIQGLPGQGENASALIVARGGKIYANGTEDAPIVFTAFNDNYEGSAYSKTTRGLWGGVIILGDASTNEPVADMQIEGIPATEARGAYGASDPANGADDHNAGEFTYVQIRHGGTDIGAGNEINGLTLGAVGNGTTIQYVEVIANKDDGLEWFGGTVNTSHILVSYCGDDSFDYDQGFHGNGQFWATLQEEAHGRFGEHDGGHENETAEPYGAPTIYNATYIGYGDGSAVTFRDNAGGTYANSIIVNSTDGIEVEYRGDKEKCSVWMFENGLLHLKNNVLFNVAGDVLDPANAESGAFTWYEEAAGDVYPLPATIGQDLADHFNNNNNIFEDLGVTATSVVPTGVGSNGTAALPDDEFFQEANYHGAFDPAAGNWAANWTLTFKSFE